MTRPPSGYVCSNCWVGTEADEQGLSHTLEAIGDLNVVFSSDYPHHDSEFPHAVEAFLGQDVPEASKRRVLWDNCARLYGLGGGRNDSPSPRLART